MKALLSAFLALSILAGAALGLSLQPGTASADAVWTGTAGVCPTPPGSNSFASYTSFSGVGLGNGDSATGGFGIAFHSTSLCYAIYGWMRSDLNWNYADVDVTAMAWDTCNGVDWYKQISVENWLYNGPSVNSFYAYANYLSCGVGNHIYENQSWAQFHGYDGGYLYAHGVIQQ